MGHNNHLGKPPEKGFFGHPKGLLTLFFTEFWERFSYYGMGAILLYYMYYSVDDGGLGILQSTASSIKAIYGSLIFMSGIIGGWIADRLLGSTRTVLFGGIFIMLGHIVLAIPAGASALYVALALIIIGTGLLKPNVSNVVGDLYSKEDQRRDAGFSIFYTSVNLGGFVAPLIVGTIGIDYNFHYGFSLSAIGMLLALLVFVFTRRSTLGSAGTTVPNPLPKEDRKKIFTIIGLVIVVLAIVAYTLIYTKILTFNRFSYLISVLGIIIPICYFIVMYRSKKTTDAEKPVLLAYIPLFIAAVMFWIIQLQGTNVLTIYAEEKTRTHFAGMHINITWFASINPFFIIFLAPTFAWIWTKLGKRQPSISKKFSLGLLFAGISYIVMIFPALNAGSHQLVSPLWLVLSNFLVVIGELCLSPVGLSATTKLAPKAFAAQTMSLWFLASAAADALNAQIVKLYSSLSDVTYFGVIGGVAIVLGIILMIVSPLLKRLSKEV